MQNTWALSLELLNKNKQKHNSFRTQNRELSGH